MLKLQEALHDVAPLPNNSLFLGLAEDGLPYILNLHDPVPGPLLIAADPNCGQREHLQVIAQSAKLRSQPNLQTVVLSSEPQKWRGFDSRSDPKTLVLDSKNRSYTLELFSSLVKWAKTARQDNFALLLIDSMANVFNSLEMPRDSKYHADIDWLLKRGPMNHVWPIVATTPEEFAKYPDYASLFRSRMFGSIQDENDAATVGMPDNLVEFAKEKLLDPSLIAFYTTGEEKTPLTYFIPRD